MVWDSHSPENDPIIILDTHREFTNGGVITCCFSYNGSLLACVGGNTATSNVVIFEWKSGRIVGRAKGLDGKTFSIHFSTDDKSVYLCGKDSFVVYNVLDMSCRNGSFVPKGKKQDCLCVCMSDEGDAIMGVEDGSIYVMRQNKLFNLKQAVHQGPVYAIYRTTTGFVTGGKDGILNWWHYSSGTIELEATLKIGSIINAIVSTPDGQMVYATKGNGDVQKIVNKKVATTLSTSHCGTAFNELWGLDVFRGTNLFVTAGDDCRVIVWNYDTRKPISQVKLGTTKLKAVSVHPSNNHIAASGIDGTVTIFSFNGKDIQQEPLITKKNATEEVNVLHYSSCGKWLVAGSRDSSIYVYEVHDNYSMYAKLTGNRASVTQIDVSKDGEFIRSNSADCDVLLFDLVEQKRIFSEHLEDIEWSRITCPLSYVVRSIWKKGFDRTDINAVDVDFSNQLVACGEDKQTVSLYAYPCTTLSPKGFTYLGHSSHVTNVLFTENNKLLTCGGGDLTVIQWSLEDNSLSDLPKGEDISLNISTSSNRKVPSAIPIVKKNTVVTVPSRSDYQRRNLLNQNKSSSSILEMKLVLQYRDLKSILLFQPMEAGKYTYSRVISSIREDFGIKETISLDLAYFDTEMKTEVHIRNERQWQSYLKHISGSSYTRDLVITVTHIK